ncbi:MAG: hypothetical protein K2M36_04540 [Clostridia bacterium]|nr:hypothetical protein [Clostridia bacterium]
MGFFYLELYKYRKAAKRQKTVNEKVLSEMQSRGFVPTRTFYFCDRSTFKKSDEYKQILAVDSERKLLGLVDYESGTFREVPFSEIVNYELYENGVMVTSGMGVGSLGIGGFSMQTSSICKELKLIIRLHRPDCPHVVYNIVSTKGLVNFGIGKNSQIYRICFPTVQEAVSLLQVIQSENKAEN